MIDSGEGPSDLSENMPVTFRVFVDRQLIEVFVNGQTCTAGVKSFTPGGTELILFAEDAACCCEELQIWQMDSALKG